MANIPGNPSAGGNKHKRGITTYVTFGYVCGSWASCSKYYWTVCIRGRNNDQSVLQSHWQHMATTCSYLSSELVIFGLSVVSRWSASLPSSDLLDDATWVTGDWMWENIFARSWRHASSSASENPLTCFVNELQNVRRRRGTCNDCVSLYASCQNNHNRAVHI